MAYEDRGTRLPGLDEVDLSLEPPSPEMAKPIATPASFEERAARLREERDAQRIAAFRQEHAPEPTADPVDQYGQIMQENEGRIGAVQAAALQKVPYSYSNPAYGPTQTYLEDMQGLKGPDGQRSGGALDRERMATAQSEEAKRLQQTRLANEYDMQIREAGTELSIARAKEQMYASEKMEQMEAQKKIQETMQGALKTIQSAPEIDPQRYWNSKSAAFKFGAALAAGLRGLSGDRNAMSHITDAIRDDIDAQKANFQQNVTAAGVVGQQSSMASNLFSQIMENVQDERAATMMLENVRLEQAKQRLEHIGMQMGVPVTTAQGQAMMAQLDQRIAQNNMQLNMMAATTPKMITGSRYVLDDRGLDLAKMQLGSEFKQQEGIVGQMGDFIGAQPKEAGKESKEAEKDLQRRTEGYGEAVSKIEPAIAALEEYKRSVEMHGVPALSPASKRARNAAAEPVVSEMFGAATDKQIEMIQDEYSGVVKPWLLDRINKKLETLKANHEAARARFGDDAAARYRNVSEDRLGTRKSRSISEGGGYTIEQD